MFPESCKYPLRALMSADSISDHKDVSRLLFVSVFSRKEFSLPENLLRRSKGTK